MQCACCGAETENEEYDFCPFCNAQLFQATPETPEPKLKIHWWKWILGFIALCCVYILFQIGRDYYDEYIYQQSIDELHTSKMTMYNEPLESLQGRSNIDIQQFNEGLPLTDAETRYAADRTNGELCVWFNVQAASLNQRDMQQALFYDAAANFIVDPALNEIDFVFNDQKIEISKGKMLNKIRLSTFQGLTQRDFEKYVLVKLLNDDFLSGYLKMDQSGLDDIANLESRAEAIMFLREKLQVGSVEISQLRVSSLIPVLVEMKKIYDRYPILYGEVQYFGQENEKEVTMSTTCYSIGGAASVRCEIQTFSKDITTLRNDHELSNRQAMRKAFSSNKWEDCGVHELGHVLLGVAVRNQYADLDLAKKDYFENTSATALVERAYEKAKPKLAQGTSMNEAIRDISVYAFYGKYQKEHLYDNEAPVTVNEAAGLYHETIAEAFADVMTNGKQANQMSICIVDELNLLLPK